MDHDQPINRPAMRPVQAAPMPPGRKVMMPRWWLGEVEPGTTLLAREQHQRRRAAKPPKHSPDEVRQKALRVYTSDVFVNYAEELESISDARH